VRRLGLVGVLAIVTMAAAFVAVYLRYEVVASDNRGPLQYYLVWDRWTGEVKVEAGLRPETEEVRHGQAVY